MGLHLHSHYYYPLTELHISYEIKNRKRINNFHYQLFSLIIKNQLQSNSFDIERGGGAGTWTLLLHVFDEEDVLSLQGKIILK